MSEESLIEALAASAAAGDEQAWRHLWRLVEPHLDRELARPRFLARLGQRAQDRAMILAEVQGRLRDRGFQRLRVYQDSRRIHARLRFLTWLRVVAKRVGVEYARKERR